MKLEWQARQVPLKVDGCWAQGPGAKALRKKLLSRSASGFRAVEVEDQLVVLGAEPPWVDGAVFISRLGNLYMPTLWKPSLPPAWIEARLQQLGEPPWLLLPSGQALGLSGASIV